MFEWDESKAKKNKSKHGISFADAFAVFEDPNALTLEDSKNDEQRYVTVGMDAFGRILVVVYTWRTDNIRIISARKAVRYEVRQYEGEI
ncbi:MAG: BrnT family toxin [Deltaproteobacteria bacterium]|nr:BrnT family toxin [Deltaproteobacteria bacterium]MBW1817682.1 BrnT family toxin [Deltaproteobacteria bacterium]MBW2283909.1 BrnT family toxin [Deltaproteobacteria bacterium]